MKKRIIALLCIFSLVMTNAMPAFAEEAPEQQEELVMQEESDTSEETEIQEEPEIQEVVEVQEEAPVVQEEVPVVQEEVPVVQEEVPVVQEEVPVVQEEAEVQEDASVVQEAPEVQETPEVQEDAPVVQEEPVIQEESAEQKELTVQKERKEKNQRSIEEEEEDYNNYFTSPLLIKDMQLKQGESAVESEPQITSADTLSVEITLEPEEGEKVTVYEIELMYEIWRDNTLCGEKYVSAEWYGDYDDYEDFGWNLEKKGNRISVPVQFENFEQNGQYRLKRVFFYYDTEEDEHEIEYTRNEDNVFVAKEYTYSSAHVTDFVLNATENTDVQAPEFTSLKIITTDEVLYTNSELVFDVGVNEIGTSGVGVVKLEFYNKDMDKTEEVWDYVYSETPLTGEQEIRITADGYGRRTGTYKLSKISLEDVAGNVRTYVIEYPEENQPSVKNADGSYTLLKDITGTNALDYSYTVEGAVYDLPTVTSISVQSEAKNLTAGEKVKVTVKLKNNTDEYLQIKPKQWYFKWEGPKDNTGEELYENTYGTDKAFWLEPGETGKVKAELETSRFTYAGLRKLIYFGYFEEEFEEEDEDSDSTGVSYEYDAQTGMMNGTDDWGQPVHSFKYKGTADYNIVTAWPDDKAPIVESVTILNKHITAPGNVEACVKLSDEGEAKLVDVWWVFHEEGCEKNILFYSSYGENLKPTETEGEYICNIQLEDDVLAGTYLLDMVTITDEADQERSYYLDDDKTQLKEDLYSADTAFNAVKMTVDEAVCTDEDFEGPKLTALSFENKSKAGELLEVKIKASDEQGVSDMWLTFVNEITWDMFMLEPESFVRGATKDEYIYQFRLPKYVQGGTYTASSLWLYDGSVHVNSSMYGCDGGQWFDEDEKEVDLGQQTYTIMITARTDVKYVDNKQEMIWDALYDAEEGDTLVLVPDSSTGEYVLDEESLFMIQDMDITMIIPGSDMDSEVIIEGSKLPEELPDELELSLDMDYGVMESPIGGNILGDKKADDHYVLFQLYCSESSIPITIRQRVDGSFQKKVMHLFTVNEKCQATSLTKKKCFAEEDGYVSIAFSTGVKNAAKGRTFALSTKLNQKCASHAKDSGTVTKTATTKRTGRKVYTCSNCCDIVKTEKINKIDKITLGYKNQKTTYTGNVKTPDVTVKNSKGTKLKKGTDYTLTYAKGRKKVGRYSVKVTFKGKYSGSKTLYFTIVPKKVTNLSAIRYGYGNQIKLSWTKATGATGYKVEWKKASASSYSSKNYKRTTKVSFTKDKLKANTKYTFRITPYYKASNGTRYHGASRTYTIKTAAKGKKLSQVKTPAVSRKTSKSVTVKWTNIRNETGYQISRSTSKTGTNIVAKVKSSSAKSKVVSAKKGTGYYYKVRAYRVVNNKYIYGAWSAPKYYKIK